MIISDTITATLPDQVRLAGLLGQRMRDTVDHRLSRIIRHPLMMTGFAAKDLPYPWKPTVELEDSSWEGDISFAWQGEHIGKWLHAAVLLSLSLNDEKLLTLARTKADELVSHQDEDGYLGTYDAASRMTAPSGPHTPVSWDVWNHRYHLFGLLTAHRYLGEERWLDAGRRIGDILCRTFGVGKKNIAMEGTRRGLSALTVLQSLVMLHEATGESSYLDLARHILYVSSEQRTRVLSKLIDDVPVTKIGDGKAYQLMAVFLGMLDLYRATGDRDLLQSVLYGWNQIVGNHLHITGGPWSKKVDLITNAECFADPEFWSPFEGVENCTTVTWIQLNLSLLRLTGEARYADEAERALYNHLMGSSSPDCGEGAYFSAPNEPLRHLSPKLHCCNSSGPRAMALFATHAYGIRESGISVNFYSQGVFRAQLPQEVILEQRTDYPSGGTVRIKLQTGRRESFPLFLRWPDWAETAELEINGKPREEPWTRGSWARLERIWEKGDELAIAFPIRNRMVQRRFRQRWVAAFTRGPLVLAFPGFSPGNREDMPVLPDSSDGYYCPEPRASDEGPAFSVPLKKPVSEGGELALAALHPYYRAGGRSTPLTTWFMTERREDR